LFLLFALQSHFAIGERHILPLYPFALLLAGGIWEHARKRRLGMAVVMLALCLNAADAVRYAPDYLAYFNLFVKPQNSWRLLTDSNLDWGQGLIALRNYEQQHPNDAVRLAYFGSVNPALYGVKALPLPSDDRSPGKVVIGASALSGQVLPDPNTHHWLLNYQPTQMIDRSMFVYDIK
ncbi:MAG: hypothetical protein WBS19_14735, partial [Candidatus Korobacteraceae bacterium]